MLRPQLRNSHLTIAVILRVEESIRTPFELKRARLLPARDALTATNEFQRMRRAGESSMLAIRFLSQSFLYMEVIPCTCGVMADVDLDL